jgi:hypothetical protein
VETNLDQNFDHQHAKYRVILDNDPRPDTGEKTNDQKAANKRLLIEIQTTPIS